jgi:hypothetical protein
MTAPHPAPSATHRSTGGALGVFVDLLTGAGIGAAIVVAVFATDKLRRRLLFSSPTLGTLQPALVSALCTLVNVVPYASQQQPRTA